MATEAEKIAASNQNAANHNSSSTTGVQNNGYTGVSSQHDQAIITNKADLAAIEKHSADAKYAYSQGDKAGVDAAHAAAEAIRAKYDYSGDVNDSQGYEYRSLAKSSGGSSPKKVSAGKYDGSYNPNAMRGYLDDWVAAAKAQAVNAAEYATNTGINELVRAQEDAQKQFQTEHNQIAIDEAKALDNQALYAEARGDKGGIGQAQYNTIQNTAAQNHLSVSQAQTKLSTDTNRQIADLRAKGEFEKADKLLSITQQYLQQLISMEQWAAQYNLSVAQFNESMRQWAEEFNFDVDKLNISTDQWAQEFNYKKEQDFYNRNQNELSTIAQFAYNQLANGTSLDKLSTEQKEAMKQLYGLSDTSLVSTAASLNAAYQQSISAKYSSSGKGKGTDTGTTDSGKISDTQMSLAYSAGYDPNDDGDKATARYRMLDTYTDDEFEAFWNAYTAYYNKMDKDKKLDALSTIPKDAFNLITDRLQRAWNVEDALQVPQKLTDAQKNAVRIYAADINR